MTKNEHELFGLSPLPPRFEGGENYFDRLRIGLVIDWLDSWPAERTHRELKKAARRSAPAYVASVLTGVESRQGAMATLAVNGHYDHGWDYDAGYHADIVGHLQDDELQLAWPIYKRLHEVAPQNVSALANLAELERRAGEPDRARALLDQAVAIARDSQEVRYRVAVASWSQHLHSARARLETTDNGAESLVQLARRESFSALTREMRSYDDVALALHRAFALANPGQRIVLHAALRWGPGGPEPPPAAHASFECLTEVESLLREVAPARGDGLSS